MGFVSDTIDTRRIEGKSAIYAYRDFGVAKSSPPLMLLAFGRPWITGIPLSWTFSPPSGV